MTALLNNPSGLRAARAHVEVATHSADALRATIRVTGQLTARSAPLLDSVIATHLGAGRRYLRVDLGASAMDHSVVDVLVRAHQSLHASGGMLVFENAGPVLVDAIRTAQLLTGR